MKKKQVKRVITKPISIREVVLAIEGLSAELHEQRTTLERVFANIGKMVYMMNGPASEELKSLVAKVGAFMEANTFLRKKGTDLIFRYKELLAKRPDMEIIPVYGHDVSEINKAWLRHYPKE